MSSHPHQLDVSMVDEHISLGPSFCDRLCLVGNDNNGEVDGAPSRVPPRGREVSTLKLWPALKFASTAEFNSALDDVVVACAAASSGGGTGGGSNSRLKARATVAAARLCRSTGVGPRDVGVAYLLDGRGSVVALPNGGGCGAGAGGYGAVFDFYNHMEEMENPRGEDGDGDDARHVSSDEFRRSFQLALDRMEASLGMDTPGRGAVRAPAASGKEKAVTMTSVTSARKMFTNVEYSDVRMEKEQTAATATATASVGSARREEAKTPVRRRDDGDGEGGRPRREDDGGGRSPSSFADTESQAESFFAGGGGGEDGAGKGGGARDEAAAVLAKANRTPRTSQTDDPDVPWNVMWSRMRAEGWGYTAGDGLVSYYYLHPTCASMRKSEFLKTRTEGVDYFVCEEDVQRYARLNLGWRCAGVAAGTPASSSPRDAAELADRVKKRRRRGARQQREIDGAADGTPMTARTARGERLLAGGAAGKARAAKKKKREGETGGGNGAARPAAGGAGRSKPKAKREEAVVAGSPESEGSTMSRFSALDDGDGGMGSPADSVARRTRSKADASPTRSDASDGSWKEEEEEGKGGASKKLRYSRVPSGSPEPSVDGSSISSSSGRSDSTGGSDSSQWSEDRTYRVMKSPDAWRLLQEKFGFSHHGDKYCLPGRGCRPGEPPAAEGSQCFGTLAEVRRHLCAYGLPELLPGKYVDEEEKDGIHHWVRHANVSALQEGALIDPDDDNGVRSFLEAWKLLGKLGMKYSSGAYIVPYADPSRSLRFERQQDFVAHLARFGVPLIEGVRQTEALSPSDRRRLDLFIARTEMDTFQRIHPKTDGVNEISPRATRSTRSNAAEPVWPVERKAKQTNKKRRYQMEFNALEVQRRLPSELLSSEDALSILVRSYNFSVSQRDGKTYYCLPGVDLVEGEGCMLGRDYFDEIQDMRKNLCAFGLPPIAKESGMPDARVDALENWVRCAHLSTTGEVPDLVQLKPKEAKDILTRLGYTYRSNCTLLPGTECQNSKPGHDQFEKLIDLYNHIAQFGLGSDELYTETPLSREKRLTLEVFIISVATVDVSHRIKCDAPITKNYPTVSEAKYTETTLTGEKDSATKPNGDTPSYQRAVVVDEGDQDTPPQQSPSKKPRHNTITKFFGAVGKMASGATAWFSPQKAADSSSDKMPPTSETGKDDGVEDPPEHAGLGNVTSDVCKSMADLGAMPNQGEDSCAASTEQEESIAPECCSQHHDNAKADTDKLIAVPDVVQSQRKSKNEVCEGQTSTLEPADVPPKIGDSFTAPGVEATEEERTGRDLPMSLAGLDHYPQPETPDMTWQALLSQMRKAGWGFVKGDILNDWYHIHPCAAHMNKTDILNKCTEGVHYFKSDCALQCYARDYLGWKTCEVGEKRRQEVDSEPPQKRLRSLENTAKQISSTNAVSDEVKSKRLKKARLNASDNSDASSQSSVINDAPPDKTMKVRDKLEKCKLFLDLRYDQKQLPVLRSGEVEDFMTKSVTAGTIVDGITLPSPGFTYICGGPGTGKTSTVNSCAKSTKKWAKNNKYNEPCFCAINMTTIERNPTNSLMKVMLKKIAKALGIGPSSDISAIENRLKEKVLILVLDEIDMLFKSHGGIGETWFKTLIGWAEDKELRFSMIGISNCVNDTYAKRVRELGHAPNELVFSSYNEEDILAIIERRIGKKVIDKKALQLISRRVANSSGDVRRALKITSEAVAKCIESLTDEELDKEVKDENFTSLVKLPHVARAIRETEGTATDHASIIEGLPPAAKVILCIALSLSQVWGPTAEVTVAQLRKYCKEATHHAMMDGLNYGQIADLVDMLVDAGLLLTDGRFNRHDGNSKLRIGVQLDDVEIAMEKSLLEVGFYKALVDYVRNL